MPSRFTLLFFYGAEMQLECLVIPPGQRQRITRLHQRVAGPAARAVDLIMLRWVQSFQL